MTAFNVVHETAYPERFLRECATTLKPDRRLFAEPRGHVTVEEFAETIAFSEALGLAAQTAPVVWRSHTALFARH